MMLRDPRFLCVLLASTLGACSPGNLREPGLGAGDDDDAAGGEGEGEGEGGGEGEGEGEGEGGYNPHNGIEVCDQLDNNGDGLVDDICGCDPGTEQACYRGHFSTRGLGGCHDGVQTCNTDDAEFPHWNECQYDALPAAELCGDGIDNDCDGREDEGCSDVDPCGNGDIPEPEVCDNGLDEDCDGLVDCADSDCDCGAPDDGGDECPAGPEFGASCADGCDNDGNGRTDCSDFTCWLSDECRDCGDENTPELCADGSDNDCDWTSDCDDPDCQALGEDVCPVECHPGECRWWHVCACCETNDHEAADCPPDSCDNPHLKYYSCVNGYWEYAGMVYECGEGSVPADCDSIVW